MTRSGPALRRFVFGSGERLGGTVYGTIVVMAALTAGSKGYHGDLWRLAVIVAATVLILWLAHVYSDGLAESLTLERRLDRAELLGIARRELSIPLAAVAPIVALVLGAVEILRAPTAVWLALAIGVATLGVQGLRYAQIEQLGRIATIVAVALNLGMGLGLVVLKVLVAH